MLQKTECKKGHGAAGFIKIQIPVGTTLPLQSSSVCCDRYATLEEYNLSPVSRP